MKYQPKYTSQGQSKFFADGRSNRLPPENTIPFDGTDYTADAGRHDEPNPDFLKGDRRYYFGIANADAKTKDADGVEVFNKPQWKDGKLAGEGYFVNHIPPLAVERAGGWEPLIRRGRAAVHGELRGVPRRERPRRRRRSRLRHRRGVRPGSRRRTWSRPRFRPSPTASCSTRSPTASGTMPGYGHQVRGPGSLGDRGLHAGSCNTRRGTRVLRGQEVSSICRRCSSWRRSNSRSEMPTIE